LHTRRPAPRANWLREFGLSPDAACEPFTPRSGADREAIPELRSVRCVKGNDSGGNTTVHFYYCGTGFQPVNWNICETRNGSSQATAQYVWGTQYTDELVFVDVNGVPTIDNDCNLDNVTAGEALSGESPADAHYFYHQDEPVALSASGRVFVGGVGG
jgi:hypothetical protein